MNIILLSSATTLLGILWVKIKNRNGRQRLRNGPYLDSQNNTWGDPSGYLYQCTTTSFMGTILYCARVNLDTCNSETPEQQMYLIISIDLQK